MKLKACKCFAVLLIVVISSFGQKQSKSTTWKIDNFEKIGGQAVTVSGHPQIIDAPGGKAIVFDGVGDSLLLNENPLAGAEAFTLEAVFRPDAGGAKEQRWFHIQEDNSENRVLLETRLVGDEWFLDTYIRSGESNRPLLAENFKHPVGAWYHVALVFDGKEMRHYVDGTLEMSGPLTIKPLAAESKCIDRCRMNHRVLV
jgi:hypothetical protein